MEISLATETGFAEQRHADQRGAGLSGGVFDVLSAQAQQFRLSVKLYGRAGEPDAELA